MQDTPARAPGAKNFPYFILIHAYALVLYVVMTCWQPNTCIVGVAGHVNPLRTPTVLLNDALRSVVSPCLCTADMNNINTWKNNMSKHARPSPENNSESRIADPALIDDHHNLRRHFRHDRYHPTATLNTNESMNIYAYILLHKICR